MDIWQVWTGLRRCLICRNSEQTQVWIFIFTTHICVIKSISHSWIVHNFCCHHMVTHSLNELTLQKLLTEIYGLALSNQELRSHTVIFCHTPFRVQPPVWQFDLVVFVVACCPPRALQSVAQPAVLIFWHFLPFAHSQHAATSFAENTSYQWVSARKM